MLTLKQVIEALVFASPKPLSIAEILAAIKATASESEDEGIRAFGSVTAEQTSEILSELNTEYANTERTFQLVEQVNGWALVTLPLAGPWVKQLYPEAKPTRLSGPALETLAIIAYRQPVTRAEMEVVRGVAVDGVMQVLLDRGLVKIAGRAEVPGRPLLYETTEYFLQHFGLRNVEELPNVTELRRVKLPTPVIAEEPVEEQPGLPLDEPIEAAKSTEAAAETDAPPQTEPDESPVEASADEDSTEDPEESEAPVETDEAPSADDSSETLEASERSSEADEVKT